MGHKTDYGRFVEEAQRLGAEHLGKIGDFDGVFYDAWRVNGQGFIVARNSCGRVGLYEFVGKDGAPVDDDIAWVVGTQPNRCRASRRARTDTTE